MKERKDFSDTMVDAIAISSPGGTISKAAKERAVERLRQDLFGEGLEFPKPAPPSESESLRRQAQWLRDLAARGMKPRKHLKEAARMEARAEELEAGRRESEVL